MKKIIIFTSSYPYGNGEQFFEEELILFKKYDYEITIQPYYYGKIKKKRKVPPDITVLKPLANFKIKNLRYYKLGIIYELLKYLINDIIIKYEVNQKRNIKWELRQIAIAILGAMNLDIENYDVLYFYWGFGAAYYIPYIKKIMKKKIICRFHGSDLYEEIHNHKMLLQREIVYSADLVLTVSEYGEKYLEKKYNRNVICNRLGTSNKFGLGLPSRDNIFRIVSCSNIIDIKRIDKIVRVISLLDNNFEWIHFGTGPLLSKIQQLITELGIAQRCKLFGFIRREEILKYYKDNPCDIFINLSETEGIPVSIMEAQSFGIPALATNVGGTSEILIPELLVDKNETEKKIADKILEFRIRWEKDRTYMRYKAREIWENSFNCEKNFKELLQYIEN